MSGELKSVVTAYADLRADYQALTPSRFRRKRKGLYPGGGPADWHYRNQNAYFQLVEMARDMERNDPVVSSMVDRAVANTIQDGFQVDPDTGDDAVNEALEARFRDWSDDPDQVDLAGELSWWGVQAMALRSSFIDGDMVILPTSDGPLELVESHRIRTPQGAASNIVHGVELAQSRQRVRYHCTIEDVGLRSITKNDKFRTFDVRDADGFRQVFHPYTSRRVSQTRGVTAFQPVFDTATMLDDLQFAKLIQAKVVSCFAILETRDIAAGVGGTADAVKAARDATVATPDEEPYSPGRREKAPPGVRLEGFSPNTPNAEFFPHVRLILTLIGINVGMPLVMVLMDASETNFSGWKGAIDQARLGFRWNQQRLIERLHRPVYVWKARQFAADDSALQNALARLGPAFFKHKWATPEWDFSIQPLQDAAAKLMRLRNGLTSPRRLHAESGLNVDDVQDEIVADNEAAIVKAKQAATRINAKFDDGQPVHWREVLSLPTPDGVTVNTQVDAGRNDDSAAQPRNPEGTGNG